MLLNRNSARLGCGTHGNYAAFISNMSPKTSLVMACLLQASIGFIACAAEPAAEPAPEGAGPVFNVKKFGALGDGKTLDTGAINKAIDAASGAGGGMVLFPAGTYMSVSIHLKSHVTLYLGTGATLE